MCILCVYHVYIMCILSVYYVYVYVCGGGGPPQVVPAQDHGPQQDLAGGEGVKIRVGTHYYYQYY